jgi:two-component system OmpR family sensor kinase
MRLRSRGLRPIRRYSFALSTRGAGDLTAVTNDELPSEMTPIVQAVNQLLERLRRSLEAERSFAANAAHELRTPVAAALAQTQRLIVESDDPATKQRATDIETALKRLNRMLEKLLQLARAEGGRLRTAIAMDVRPVLRMIIADLDAGRGGITLEIPAGPVLSDIDPDAFAVLSRNLIENAVKHGADMKPVRVILTDGGLFRVVNGGPPVPPDVMERLTARFERGQTIMSGSGLGLAIARAIADGVQETLTLHSPAVGQPDGFEAVFQLPNPHDV